MSLRSEAIAAYEASQSDRVAEARAALAAALTPWDVTALTVEDVDATQSYTLVVFTDGDIRLGVRTRPGSDAWDVHLVEPAGGGVTGWREEGPVIESLGQLGKVLPDLDPVDENAAPATPAWQTDVAVKVGEEYTHGGFTWRVLQAHTTAAHWAPGAAPTLWVKVA